MGAPKTVASIMSPDPITLREEENLADVQDEMERLGLRHLPVVDGKKLVGLVTHRDILRWSLNRFEGHPVHRAMDERRRASTFVAEIMTRDVATVSPTTPIPDAALHMLEHKYGCLPVVEADGTLLGIVTEHDFTRALTALPKEAFS